MKNKLLYTAFFFMSLTVAFWIGKEYQQPEYSLAFEKTNSYGKIGSDFIDFKDLPGSVQIELLKLDSLKRKLLENSIQDIVMSHLNTKNPEILSSIKEDNVSDAEVSEYMKKNQLVEDDSLKERVKNKLLIDKQKHKQNNIIAEYSSKEKITIFESPLQKVFLDEKKGININHQGKKQVIFFIDLDKTQEVESVLNQVEGLEDTAVSIFPIVRNNPYRDENLLKFICMQNSQKNISLTDLNKAYLTIKSKYECNDSIVRNNLYNVANYPKSIGVYSSGVLVEGQWHDLSNNLKKIFAKRLIP